MKYLLTSQSPGNRRTVVAAVRSAERAREVLSECGVDVDRAEREGRLSIVGGVDVTDAATLSPNPELWEGVSQAAVSLGPVFARLPGGGMGYLDGMTSEAVDVSFEKMGEKDGERRRDREKSLSHPFPFQPSKHNNTRPAASPPSSRP